MRLPQFTLRMLFVAVTLAGMFFGFTAAFPELATGLVLRMIGLSVVSAMLIAIFAAAWLVAQACSSIAIHVFSRMNERRHRLRLLIAAGLSISVLSIVAMMVRGRMLDIHRPAVERRRTLEVEIERTGRGEILYERADNHSKLVRPGDASQTLSWWDMQLGDRPVTSILFYRKTLTPKDLDDASHFPEADIYVWTIATDP